MMTMISDFFTAAGCWDNATETLHSQLWYKSWFNVRVVWFYCLITNDNMISSVVCHYILTDKVLYLIVMTTL